MTAVRRVAAAPAVALSGLVGLTLIIAPWVLLLISRKSPLQVHDAGYINGFAMGMGFMFFQLVGIGYLAGAIGAYRRRSSAVRPAP